VTRVEHFNQVNVYQEYWHDSSFEGVQVIVDIGAPFVHWVQVEDQLLVLAFAPCRLGLIGIRETDPEDSFDPIEVERVALKISHQNGDVIRIG